MVNHLVQFIYNIQRLDYASEVIMIKTEHMYGKLKFMKKNNLIFLWISWDIDSWFMRDNHPVSCHIIISHDPCDTKYFPRNCIFYDRVIAYTNNIVFSVLSVLSRNQFRDNNDRLTLICASQRWVACRVWRKKTRQPRISFPLDDYSIYSFPKFVKT